MTPAVQRAFALAVVLLAAAYLSWRSWRRWRANVSARRAGGCGPGCGCE